ncbi:LLM class flavin-dependent oxidoreductase [Baekduia soli]|uniref:LLM class flavin-dependent oxidoreductase n=1 Tax=Baekduia soli TaxID=496014 RepID=A0A5B8UAW9_9ACTN|nr:LLM class flavin-dependent oxidoreductase [Baekduia soli]QEC50185.1 LLM class flavin-dependent oxidoreductase [Baekduia soli]
MTDPVPVGVALGSQVHPGRLVELGRRCEELGFSEIWLTEDYFYTSAVAGAAGILGVTEHVPVGFGILSGLVRHPAVLAMEIATLAHMHPGRVLPGIGLGLPMWLEQMRLRPRSQLGALREVFGVLRGLLAGEHVTSDGLFGLVDVQLEYPAPEVPLLCGVIGPKMLAMAGEVADGVVGSVMAGETYLRVAAERIAAGGPTPLGFRALVLFACDRDGARARASARESFAFFLTTIAPSHLVEVHEDRDAIRALAAQGADAMAAGMDPSWMEDLAVVGTPDECAAKIAGQLQAGATTVSLFPASPPDADEQFALAGREVLPQLA